MLIQETENEGLMGLMGRRITCYCARYIYTGDLAGVNDTCVKLANPAIVYETGSYDNTEWSDAQKLPNDFYIKLDAIESFGVLK